MQFLFTSTPKTKIFLVLSVEVHHRIRLLPVSTGKCPMPLFRKRGSGSGASRRPGGLPTEPRFSFSMRTASPEIGSEELAVRLNEFETRRNEYLRCGGMHTEAVKMVVRKVCEGKYRGPGMAFIAPALYEGIPEFVDKTMDTLGELAVYASLYMGLIAAAG